MTRKAFGNDAEIKYSYDNMDRSKGINYVFGGQSKTTAFSYGADSRKSLTTLLSGGKMTFSYDTLNRNTVTDLNPNPGDPTLRTKAEFLNVSGNRTTTLTGTYSNFRRVGSTNTVLSQYQYTYDDNGNISTVADAQNNVTTYAYDGLNQLVRADDQKAGTSTTYSYDAGGNITTVSTYAYTTGELGSPTNTISYAYDNANWKDLLTSYNGQSITYDQIGNPLAYRDGMSFTWEGRQLRTAAVNGKGISYTYNNDGIRTGKTVDGVTTEYLVDGSNVLAQKTRNDVLWFLYDSDGTRVGFTYNDTAYYYTKNAQGDVTGIVDTSANTVVEYSYDAWGKLLTTTGNMADTIGKLNPFLYRGYYYDAETGLYHLNSRYYDTQTGRFINADGFISTGQGILGNNMFAYCGNNPVIRVDTSGYGWFDTIKKWIKGIFTNYNDDKSLSYGATAGAAAGIKIELSQGWTARIDPENAQSGTKRHIHVERRKEKFAQNKDGSPHDGSSGSPPKSVRKELKEKANWDWDKKAKSWDNQQQASLLHVYPCGADEGECVCHLYNSGSYFNYFGFSPYAPNIPAPVPSPYMPFAPAW
ncbi:RHS repeat-associated core domain-containing protein [Faecalispora jeddahensis]|uniref:RHS repeat-associated core domain-containing protein n=2 Tax=Faecalispora jeddahensis TaxID=1414721 RepID=UPI0004BBDC3F|nr:RHS repeat-associated core domain-containing protein [Faecalispora jeddahensis]